MHQLQRKGKAAEARVCLCIMWIPLCCTIWMDGGVVLPADGLTRAYCSNDRVTAFNRPLRHNWHPQISKRRSMACHWHKCEGNAHINHAQRLEWPRFLCSCRLTLEQLKKNKKQKKQKHIPKHRPRQMPTHQRINCQAAPWSCSYSDTKLIVLLKLHGMEQEIYTDMSGKYPTCLLMLYMYSLQGS